MTALEEIQAAAEQALRDGAALSTILHAIKTCYVKSIVHNVPAYTEPDELYSATERADEDDDSAFDQWIKELDLLLANVLGGLTTEDLPDREYREMFESGLSPMQIAQNMTKDLE